LSSNNFLYSGGSIFIVIRVTAPIVLLSYPFFIVKLYEPGVVQFKVVSFLNALNLTVDPKEPSTGNGINVRYSPSARGT
jgi:hypothetical protein